MKDGQFCWPQSGIALLPRASTHGVSLNTGFGARSLGAGGGAIVGRAPGLAS